MACGRFGIMHDRRTKAERVRKIASCAWINSSDMFFQQLTWVYMIWSCDRLYSWRNGWWTFNIVTYEVGLPYCKQPLWAFVFFLDFFARIYSTPTIKPMVIWTKYNFSNSVCCKRALYPVSFIITGFSFRITCNKYFDNSRFVERCFNSMNWMPNVQLCFYNSAERTFLNRCGDSVAYGMYNSPVYNDGYLWWVVHALVRWLHYMYWL